MTHPHDLRVVLCDASYFEVGEIWWCESCDAGGFVGGAPRHRRGCLLDELS